MIRIRREDDTNYDEKMIWKEFAVAYLKNRLVWED
jgi:hypothetical protein